MKILIEIFCQKLIVSNVFSAFLDYLKPIFFFFCRPTMVAGIEPPLFKISASAPGKRYCAQVASDVSYVWN